MGASVSSEEEELLLQNFHKACSDFGDLLGDVS